MAKFNGSLPYSTVHGDHPASYEQAGVLYDGRFNPLNAEPDADSDVESELLETPETPETSDVPVDYDSMNWREVKKLVIAAGGEWSSKIEGITFLKGL